MKKWLIFDVNSSPKVTSYLVSILIMRLIFSQTILNTTVFRVFTEVNLLKISKEMAISYIVVRIS